MVGVLFLLNQYVVRDLDTVISDVWAARYGSGYIVAMTTDSNNTLKILKTNGSGYILESFKLIWYNTNTVYGIAVDEYGNPVIYGSSSGNAFYAVPDTSNTSQFIHTFLGLPKFVDAVQTSNGVYLFSYRGDSVYIFKKGTNNYRIITDTGFVDTLIRAINDIDAAYEPIGKKIYLVVADSNGNGLILIKMDSSFNISLAKKFTISSVSQAFIDVSGDSVVVGYGTPTSIGVIGVLVLDTTNLNISGYFEMTNPTLLSGVRFHNGKIYLYGTSVYPKIAILNPADTSANSVEYNGVLAGNVRFLDPENNVAIFRGDYKATFMKSNSTFSGTCYITSSTDTVDTLSSPGSTALSLVSSDSISSTSSSFISKHPYSPRDSIICFSGSPPTVVFTVPDSGDIDVSLSANIGVWFSRDIDTNTVNNSTVSITGWDGSSFRSYSFNKTCPMPTFCVLDPTTNFRPNEEVTVRFTSGIIGIAGIPLTPKVIVFRTQGVDTLNPVIVFTTPDSGATNVPENTKISVQFSKDMDTTTINTSNITITGSSSGSRSFTKVCRTLSYCEINPSSSFNFGDTVTVEFRSGIRALNGRNLVPKVVTFTVGSPDASNPNITIISDPDDTVRLYDRNVPVKAHLQDDYNVQRVEWVINSQTYVTPTNCRDSTFNNPDTACFLIPDLPTGTYKITAYAYDYAGNVGMDTAILYYQDTIRPQVVFTDPANNSYGVSPTPQITVVFSEGMDTTSGSLDISVGSTTYPYTKYWEDLRTLKINPTTPLPYDSTVKVTLRDYRDISGNVMVGDSFSFKFTIISNAEVYVKILRVEPQLVYKGSPDSTYILAEVFSNYTIRGAKLVIDGTIESSMFAQDGSFDEPVETVYVRFRFGDLEVGEHALNVRAWNDYVERMSDPFTVSVKMLGFLDKENLIVYPNPSKGKAKLRVIFGANTNASIEVFDLKVKRVYYREGNFEGFKIHEFELPNLPVGIYLVRVKAGDKKVEKWFSVIK